MPFYAALGRDASGLAVGALAVAAASAAGALLVAWRSGGARLGVWTFFLLIAYLDFLGPRLGDVWNPHVTIVPYLLFLFLCAALSVGRAWTLPAIAVVGSFLLQTHVGLLPSVVLVLAGSALSCGIRTRRHPSGVLGAAAVGAALLLLFWLPPLAEELAHTPGNLSRLYAFFRGARANHGFGEAFVQVARAIGAPSASLLGLGCSGFGPESACDRFETGAGILLAAALPLAMVRALRRGGTYAAALSAVSLLAALAALWSVSRIVGDVYAHLVVWITAVGAVGLTAVGGAIFAGLDAGAAGREADVRWSGAAVFALVAFGAALHLVKQSAQPEIRGEVHAPTLALAPAVERFLGHKEKRRPLFRVESHDAWPLVAGIVLYLDKRGFEPRVPPDLDFLFGPELSADAPADAVVFLVRSPADHELAGRFGLRKIGTASPFAVYAAEGERLTERTLEFELARNGDDYVALTRLRRIARSEGRVNTAAELERILRDRFTAEHPVGWSFGSELNLLGYDSRVLGPGRLEMTYYWRALRRIDWEYAIYVHFRHGSKVVFQDDHFPTVSSRTTRQWRPGEIVKVKREIVIPPGSPSGGYRIELGVWAPASRHYPRLGEGGPKGATLLHLSLLPGRRLRLNERPR